MTQDLEIPRGWRLDAVESDDVPQLAPVFEPTDTDTEHGEWRVGRVYQLVYRFARSGQDKRIRARFDGVRGNALRFTRLYGKHNEVGEHVFLADHLIQKRTWKRGMTTRKAGK